MLRSSLAVLLCAMLAACASAPPGSPTALQPGAVLRDASFAPSSQPVGAEGLFELSGEMRAFAQAQIVPRARRDGPQRALVDALYERGSLKLEYEGAYTRTASEAFAAKAGNCLSLVVMTAAFARELGVPVVFRSVLVDEVWSRQGDLSFGSQHVNVTLGPPVAASNVSLYALTVDFVPAAQLGGVRTRDLSEATVVGMYLNNRAAESLAAGRIDDAYWWAREAVLQAPQYGAAWNTLAVVYLRHGDLEPAAQVLESLLARAPDDIKALANLVGVRERQGRVADAQALRERLARIEPVRPFHHYDIGLAALRSGDPKAARDAFERELRRDADYHEFHHWLAISNLMLGDTKEARRHMELALRNSTTRRDQQLYGAKLDRLMARRPGGGTLRRDG